MLRLRHKKAFIVPYWLLAGVLVGLVIFFVTRAYGIPEGEPNYAGEIGLQYIKAAKDTQLEMSFVEDSARQGIDQTIFDLGSNGGYLDEPECGRFNDFNMWQSMDMPNGKREIKSCFPDLDMVEGSFKSYLGKYMNEFFDDYCFNMDTCPFRKDNYDFLLDGNLKIRGFATIPLTTVFYDNERNPDVVELKLGEHKLMPSFTQTVDYDLDDYELVKAQAITVNAVCANAVDLRGCILEESGKIEGWGVNFCPVFPEEEKNCLDRNKNLAVGETPYVSWFGKEWIIFGEPVFDRCDHCPESGAECKDYIDERYCMQDPCNLGCVWAEDNCREITVADIDKMNDERTFGFCVVGDKKFLSYDKEEERAEERPVTIKFAMYIEDLPPPPLEGVSAVDNKNAENSVMLRWKKSTAEDVDNYVVYYANKDLVSDFSEMKTEDMREDSMILVREIGYDEDEVEVFDSIGLDDCELKTVDDETRCVFSGDKVIDANALYYVEDTDEMVYVLYDAEISEDSEYYLAVTAIDKGDNEVNNVDTDQKLEVVEGKSEDDLGPGLVENLRVVYDDVSKEVIFEFDEVEANLVSDYPLDDFGMYVLYYQGCSEPTDYSHKKELSGSNVRRSVSYYPNCGDEESYVYYFFVVAEDAKGNPVLGFDKMKELGLEVKAVTIG